MDMALYVLTWASFLGGGFFLIVGGIGLLRFPDFYTRLHAAGMTDTLGVGLMLLGMMMQLPEAGLTLTAVRVAFIGFFMIFFTSPTSTRDRKCSLFSRFKT